MRNKLEASLHLAVAVVTSAAPFFLTPVAAGLMLATISIALAANAATK